MVEIMMLLLLFIFYQLLEGSIAESSGLKSLHGHYEESEDMVHPLGQYNGNNIFTIRLLIMADKRSYKKWMPKSDNNKVKAEENMKFYFAHIIDGVNKKYKNLHILNKGFKVIITGFYFLTKNYDNQFIERSKISEKLIDGSRAIMAMREWLNVTIKELKSKYRFDGIILFTSYNIDGLSGVAFRGSICSKSSAGIIRDFGIVENIDTTTHELGHMLGSWHDGERNQCNPGDQYIMSTVRRKEGSEKTNYFSACSISSIQQNLDRLKIYKCLQKEADISKEIVKLLRTKPGMKLSPNDQCQLMYGSQSYFCGGGGSIQQNICREMLCWNTDTRRCDATTRQKAADGTPCGNEMWCMEGRCVQSTSAPKNSHGKCLYGDFRGISYAVRKSCDDVRAQYPWLCYKDVVQVYCCSTCEALRDRSRPECEYGDKDHGCSISVCHDQTWKNTCCKTCYKKSDVTDRECPEGDLASWCSSTSISLCYKHNQTCCATCGKYYNASAKKCEYGDRESWCPSFVAQHPEECLQPNSPCCKSCKRRKDPRRGQR